MDWTDGYGQVFRFDGVSLQPKGPQPFIVGNDAGPGFPRDIEIGPDGSLYIASGPRDRGYVPYGLPIPAPVKRYNSRTGEFIDDFVEIGEAGLNFARGLAFAPDGSLYVASDNDQIAVFNASGVWLRTLSLTTPDGDVGPGDIEWGPAGQLLVGSSVQGTVLAFDPMSGAFLSEFTMDGAGLLQTGPFSIASEPPRFVPESGTAWMGAGALALVLVSCNRRRKGGFVKSRGVCPSA